ncbi:MAG: hypothetical protein K1X28_03845 [Parachlamydiales bacterium]|nr:hypothetical protein [Parachlamydiales bacterium]
MNRISKMITVSLCLLCVHFGYAQNSTSGNGSCAPACPPKECPKPCAPKPCPPKPCPPKPCPPKPCPPKPCKPPCPPVCFERGYPDTKCCIPSAYNEPADYELSPCPWDFWVDASFTYWTAYEEGLTLARSNADYTGVPIETAEPRVMLFQDTKWEPGFKIGMGVDLGHDHWSAFAEYTWFRSRTTTSEAAPEGPAGTTVPQWTINNFGLDNAFDNVASISSVWRLRMDLLDVGLTRPYYQGTHLIVAPFGGIRAEWIRQNLRVHPTPLSTATAVNTNAVFHNKSHSWAVGPRGGFQGEWHLGWGFRVEGDVAGSIQFTRYTHVASYADSIRDGFRAVSVHYDDYNTIRFNNDMSLGLGWGDYFDCRNYHFDLLVTYDFQIFWNQNMMRMLVDEFENDTSAAAHNLYLQGLTVRAQFDF